MMEGIPEAIADNAIGYTCQHCGYYNYEQDSLEKEECEKYSDNIICGTCGEENKVIMYK